MSVIPLSGFINSSPALQSKYLEPKEQELKDAVQSFQTLLWEEVLKSAERAAAQFKDDESGAAQQQYFTEMLHSQFAMQMVRQADESGFSLTDQIEKQLSAGKPAIKS